MTCYGNQRMFAVIEETVGGGHFSGNPQRLFYSSDNGQNWTEGTLYDSQWNLWKGVYLSFGPPEGAGISPVSDTLLVGNFGPANGVLGADRVIAKSTDGGSSWGSPVDAGFFNIADGDYWHTNAIIRCGGNRIIAAGWFRRNHLSYNLLVSDDNGATFSDIRTMQAGEFDPAQFVCGCYAGGDIVLLGSDGAVYDAMDYIPGFPVWRSADNGQTWSRHQLTSTQFSPDPPYGGLVYLAAIGASTVVAVATALDGAGNYLPLCWISTDDGQTWTERSSAVAALVGTPTDELVPQWAAGWGDAQIAIGLFRQTTLTPLVIYSENGGNLWQTADTPASLTNGSAVEIGWGGVGKADDGSLSVSLYQLDSNANLYYQIWRGTATWPMGSGPCVTINAGVAGCPQLCGRPIYNNPCPQPCEPPWEQ